MEKLNWKKAIEDYGKKSSGSAATTKTASPSGVLSWQQAMDEYDQYDDDGYKALGEQRKRYMTQHRAAQKQAQEETAQKQAQKMAEQKARVWQSQTRDSFSAQADEDIAKRSTAPSHYSKEEPAANVPFSDSGSSQVRQNESYGEYVMNRSISGLADAGWQEYLDDQEAAREEREKTEAWLSKPHFGVDPMTIASMSVAVDDSYKLPTDQWTQEEREIYGILYGTNREKADQFAIDTNNAYSRQEQQQQLAKVEQFADKHPILSTAFGDTAQALGLGMADFLTFGIEQFARGATTQHNYVSPSHAADEATGRVAENLNYRYGTIDESIPVFGGRGWGDVYQLMNSVVESAAATNLTGVIGTDIIFFGNAAASALREAKERGATDEQAFDLAVIAGTAEALGEHFSASHLLEMTDATAIKAFFGTMFGQAFEEAEEEFFTSAVNNIAENYIMQDKSNFNIYVEKYMQANPDASEEEARKAAWKNMWSDMAFDAVGGFASGGIHTVGQIGAIKAVNAINSARENAQYHSVDSVSAEKQEAADGEPVIREEAPVSTESEESASAEEEIIEESASEMPMQNAQEETDPVSLEEEAETEASGDNLEALSQKYGKYAEFMRNTYQEGQDVQEYDNAFGIAFDMGQSGLNKSALERVDALRTLSQNQREIAYELGAASAAEQAKAQSGRNEAASNGKQGWRKGTVRGEGVTIADLTKTFNDPQRKAYSVLSTIAKATGIDIVLYQSKANEDGVFQGEQGRFKWSDNTIYIDVNAGLSGTKDVGSLAKYTMLRTFGHEFTHFIEKWNPEKYNEFRKAVFSTMKNPEDLIETRLAQDRTGKMTYDEASREVVAEAMTDILDGSQFLQQLAAKHTSVFETLRSKLKEFVDNLKSYFKSLARNGSREARLLKQEVGDSISYLEDIVKQFDDIAVQAVENYQKTVAEDEQSAPDDRIESDSIPDEGVLNNGTQEQETGSDATEVMQYDGFSITPNMERGTLEVRFDSKPSEKVRDVLKANGFRWSSKNKLWYGNGDPEAIGKSIQRAIQENNGSGVKESKENESKGVSATPSEKIADRILSEYLSVWKKMEANDLYRIADEAFGGTQAEGAYNRKDAYDAMELAVNRYLLTYAKDFNSDADTAVQSVKRLQELLSLLPTQTVRTQEQLDFQQFSTPPNIAYLAAWSANISRNDSVLEPSAGIGGLAVFAKAWGADVTVNELSKRRLGVLRSMGFDRVFNENAEQIDNILPDSVSPSVVIMNPPFSSTAGRTKTNRTSNAEKHIDQALSRLRDGGRLVAILGTGMNDADYSKYWNKVRQKYNIRANLSIDGNNYKKYGTTYDVQLVVIDKSGPQTGETLTGRYTDLTLVPKILEGIRNDRGNVEENRLGSGTDRMVESVADGGNRGDSETGRERSSERNPGGSPGNERNGNRAVDGKAERRDGGADGQTAAKTGREASGREDGRAVGTDTGADSGNGAAADGQRASDYNEPQLPQQGLTEEVSDDGVYSTFVAPDIPVKGSRKHPAVLVESAAMAAVSMPKATYSPKLPSDVIKNNLSDAQMVSVTYAGQAHEQTLPDGRRKGFFIGDGTGVGKGRQIAGIILDNFMQGREKAVWISKNDDLFADAVRDWTQTTGRSKDEVFSQGKFKPNASINVDKGILFTSYGKLKMEKGGNRLDQIVNWVGEDFDGVIAFDEAHFMGNLYGKKGKFGKSKGSLTAKAGVELQRRLPNARIVYVSATAATEVDNLAYAERLGLWGKGTAFNDAQDFISKIGSSGLAAMELVIRDMKSMGSYVSRSISYNGVNYDTVEHTLDPMQTEIYDTMSRAWQKTMSNVQDALSTTGGNKNSNERQRAIGNFYSAMQRFYNQVLTSMSMPSVIADMRKELADGHSCVIQIVNTNEAQQNKQLAEAKASGESLDNLDMTPREALIGYLESSFPTQMFEEYTDEDGELRSRPVVDSSGKPVQSKEAIRQRDALIAEVNQMSIPDGPLEMLFDAFGTDAVAENTGRSRRVVPKKQADGSIARVEERRTLNHRTADVQAFQDGKKRILVFSDAGGTGKSYHADRSEKNQQVRIHYVLQPGWVASNAVQGFGRTHRSNEVHPPVYKLVTTNIKGQKRFTSTIARRLDQLGALTKGQRDTGSGMFGAKDNLETDLAKDSLREFYRRLGKNQIEGIDGLKTLDRLGLKQKFTDEYGAFKLNDALARDVSTFLNRILSLEVDEQNTVFDSFISIYEMELEAAIQSGTLDTGMENVKADKVEILDDKIIREDKNSGAATHYIQAKTYTKPRVITTVSEISNSRAGFVGIYKTEKGAVKAVFRIADKTTEWGAVQKQYRLVGPNQGAKTSVWSEATLSTKATEVEKADWQKNWDEEVSKVPEYNEDTLHMLTGALLPIWNSLPQEGNTKVKRLISSDGNIYLGRVIDSGMIDNVLRGFSVGRTMERFTPKQVMEKAIKDGTRFQLQNRIEIFRSRVSGQWRLEITMPNAWYLARNNPGLIQERISYRDRYFIPMNDNGLQILDNILKNNQVRSTSNEDEEKVQYQGRDNLSKNEMYRFSWPYHSGILTWIELQKVQSAIANYSTGRYDSYKFNGSMQIAYLSGTKYVLFSGNIENPKIEYVIERDIGIDKDTIDTIRTVLEGGKYADAQQILENVYGEEHTRIYSIRDFQTDAWENGGTEGGSRQESNQRYGKWGSSLTQKQDRTNTLTDREILSMAAEDTSKLDNLTDAESDALQIFRKRLDTLDQLQSERKELGKEYKQLQFGQKPDRQAAAQTLEKMHQLDRRIQEAENKVLTAETAPALKQVLPRARRIVEQNQKKQDDAVLQRWRDRRDNAAAIKKYRTRITKDVADMSSWILSPSNKTDMKHVPEVLKNTVIQFLSGIDFTSKRNLNGGKATIADQEFMKRISALRKAMTQNIDENGLYSGYNDLPPNFMENLDAFIASAQAIVNQSSGESVINRMTSQELKSLSEIVTALKKLIQNFNKFHANAVYQHVYDAGDATIGALSKYQDAKSRTKMGESMKNFIFWNQIRPAYAFERFGPGGKAIYDGLRRGQAQLAFDTREIVSFSEKAYTEEEVKAWDKEVKTIQLEDGEVKLPVSQIMSFYELLKREQAKGHIFGQGIRASTFFSKNKKVSDTGHTITVEDANRIISALTPRQIEVADKLQQYMQEKGGSWGNYVSVKRFGEKLFGEENYFPINSDGRHLEANADGKIEGQSLYALLNMGFTKKLQEKANNRIVLYSIFDVFSNHMAGMAQYHSMALPVLDALKWFNYQQKETVTVIENGKERVTNQVVDSVRDQLDRVYGVPEETRPGSGKRGYAENFITGILKAFNGTETQGISSDEVGLNSLRRYNMAQVAYNFRVVIQQPLAITRAGMIIDYASIIRGLRLSPKAIQKNIDEMNRYSGIAAWKDLGFYDTNISRGLTDIIKHSKTGMEKFREFGMIGAEKADQLTWAAMWSACKEEVRRKYRIQPGSDHFFEAVTSLFEEVVYKTQVVDSVLTKNEYLRSKGLFARATGSFMSEPTTTASMLADAFDKYRMDLQSGMSMRQAWEKNNRNIGRTALVYGVGVILLSAVQAIADAFRDDDKYEKYKEKWMEAFIGNFIDELLPFNKLPLVSDFYDLSKQLLSAVGVDTYGFNPSSIWMQWYDSLVKCTEIIYARITNDEKNRYTWYGGIYKLLQAASGMTGVPMAAITREFVTSWNSTVGQMVPGYYIRSYEQKPETEIKYTFLDGNMSEEEAKQALIQYAGYSADDAKKKVDVLSFQKENPLYSEASETSIEKYLEFGSPNKISQDVFFDVWAFENDAVADRDKDGKPINGSKRDKVCDYIDKQNLTQQQKDALYLTFGYSEKNLKDTPWH